MKSMGVVILATLAAAAYADEQPTFAIEDASNTADAMYETCKPERYLDSLEDYDAYRAASRKVSGEEWAELDHYACRRKVVVERGGVAEELYVNLSGAGVLTIGGKTEYLDCAEECRERAGWERPAFD